MGPLLLLVMATECQSTGTYLKLSNQYLLTNSEIGRLT